MPGVIGSPLDGVAGCRAIEPRGNGFGPGTRRCAAPLDGRGSWALIEGVGLVGPAGAVPPASSRTGSPARHLAMPSRLPVPHVARQFTSTRRCCFPSTLSRSPDHRAPPDESRERTRRSAFQKAPRASPPEKPGLPSIRRAGFRRSISSWIWDGRGRSAYSTTS